MFGIAAVLALLATDPIVPAAAKVDYDAGTWAFLAINVAPVLAGAALFRRGSHECSGRHAGVTLSLERKLARAAPGGHDRETPTAHAGAPGVTTAAQRVGGSGVTVRSI